MLGPVTRGLHSRSLASLDDWLAPDLQTLLQCPLIIDRLMEAFGAHLFGDAAPLYKYLMAVTVVQALHPPLRKQLPFSWKLASTWAALEPAEHRRPLPVVLYRALVVTTVCAGSRRLAAVCIVAFMGLARIGEVLRATRGSLVLLEDVLFDPIDKLYLEMVSPKSRYRGGGARQNISVSGLLEVTFVGCVLRPLPGDSKLYLCADATFRARWDAVLVRLGIPSAFELTPASVRAGGIVHAYHEGAPIADLLWSLRLQHQRTLCRYLQEVATATSMRELPMSGRSTVRAAADLYCRLLRAARQLAAV